MSGKTFYVMLGLLLSATAVGAQSAEGQIIIDPNLMGWWPFEEGQGSLALDASGHGNHATLVGDPQWASGYDGLALDFDGQGDYLDTGKVPSQLGVAGDAPRTVALWVYTRSFDGGGLYEMGGDGMRESFSLRTQDIDGGWQARYGGIDANFYAESLNEWVHLAHVFDGSRAEIYVDPYWRTWDKITLSTTDAGTFRIGLGDDAFFDGMIDDVRLYNRAMTSDEIERIMYGSPLLAAEPQPSDGAATDIARASVLSWSPGAIAVGHDVYFGADEAQVADATPATPGIYRGRLPAEQTDYALPEAPPDWNAAYWWRVDEINPDGTVTVGKMWSFTTVNHLIIDDFESYTDDIDAGETIFDTWCDGWYNGTGSTVGYFVVPFAPFEIPVHSGRQSMPFSYDNVDEPWYSEAVRTWEEPQDWTRYGVDVLTLHFIGNPIAFFERSDGGIVMSGAREIGGTRDHFRFAYKPLRGDGSIVARIDSIDQADPNAMAGVMIRWDLEQKSQNVALFVTAGNGISFQYRREEGGPTERTLQAGPVPPYWVKLAREGETITAQCSPDGTSWNPVTDDPAGSSVEISSAKAFAGLAVATPAWDAATAEFSNIAVAGSDADDWEVVGIGYNGGNDPDPMYVALADAAGNFKAVTHPDPLAVGIATWQRWDVPLSEFASAGVDVTAIRQMIVGFGDRDNPVPSGTGMVHFDDFWLTRSTAP
ncbi:MAG TPA: hypothetical protein PLU87_05745 [Sedimentisphaerales bacterium]|nr:hypothetical protein [Sedimentisphaerales bacterium]HRS10411.1 hypothetical protein [Sedimentisphaerales bacterium]HRV47116.1 hypothetical protein [Sedimentisphaerales bacterium]